MSKESSRDVSKPSSSARAFSSRDRSSQRPKWLVVSVAIVTLGVVAAGLFLLADQLEIGQSFVRDPLDGANPTADPSEYSSAELSFDGVPLSPGVRFSRADPAFAPGEIVDLSLVIESSPEQIARDVGLYESLGRHERSGFLRVLNHPYAVTVWAIKLVGLRDGKVHLTPIANNLVDMRPDKTDDFTPGVEMNDASIEAHYGRVRLPTIPGNHMVHVGIMPAAEINPRRVRSQRVASFPIRILETEATD